MLKFVFLLFLTLNLYATTSLSSFIDSQLKVEKQLNSLDINSTIKEQVSKTQISDYEEFLTKTASKGGVAIIDNNSYMIDVSKLKLRISSNTEAGNHLAIKRDEVTLESMKIEQDIALLYKDILTKLSSTSMRSSKEVISNEVNKFLGSYKSINNIKYKQKSLDNNHGTVATTLYNEIDDRKNLDYVAVTFCTQLIKNSSAIFSALHFSRFGFSELDKNIESTIIGAKVSKYLKTIDLSVSMVIFTILLFIILVVLVYLVKFIFHIFISHYFSSEESVSYVKNQVYSLLNIIAIVAGIEIIFLIIFGLDNISEWMIKSFKIIYVLLITTIFYNLNKSIPYLKLKSSKHKDYIRKEVLHLIVGLDKVLIIILSIAFILKILGVNLTTLLGGLGLGGFAIAFAAKDSISNIFGSISILASDTFEQGEWIEVDGQEGTVVEIGLRATTIRTFDNAMISVPNLKLANAEVKNWSRRKIGRRIKMYISVSFNSNFDSVEKALEDIKEMLKTHPDITNEHTQLTDNAQHIENFISPDDMNGIKRTLLVNLDKFSDSGMDIMIYCFSKSIVWDEWLNVKEDVLFKIGRILEKNSLELSYPTQIEKQMAITNT